jgi:hypothetical protein
MEGLTMAIKKKVGAAVVTMPDVFYTNDGLAQLICDAWTDAAFRGKLLERDAKGDPTPAAVAEATNGVKAKGFNLQRAVVISEDEYDNDYTMQQDNEVVLVLPKENKIPAGAGGRSTLLETARFLMARTPNGI